MRSLQVQLACFLLSTNTEELTSLAQHGEYYQIINLLVRKLTTKQEKLAYYKN